jgi:hypothetical protein
MPVSSCERAVRHNPGELFTMNRRHNRFQPALSPLEDRPSLSYTIVNSYQNNAHIWGTVQVYNHRAHWDLHIRDVVKDGDRVKVELDMDLPFRPDPRKFSGWAGAPNPVEIHWVGNYQYGFPTPLRGVHVKVDREHVGSQQVTYVGNS